MLAQNPIYDSMCMETGRVLDSLIGKFDCTETEIVRMDGRSRDGFISFTDGGARADTLVPVSEIADFLSTVGAGKDVVFAAERFHANNLGFKLDEWCAESSMPRPKFPPIREESDLRKFWDAYDGFIGEHGIDVESDPETFDDDDWARLSIGFHLNSPGHFDADSEKPFYCYASVNFDSPYYRDQGEIARNIGSGAQRLDFLLGESDGEEPETMTEFSAIMSEMVKSAFPKADPARLGLDESGPKA